MLDSFSKIISILSPKARKELTVLMLLALAAAILQVASVGSVVPFMSAAVDSGSSDNSIHRKLFTFLGFEDQDNFLIPASVLMVFTILISNAVNAGATYSIIRFGAKRERELSLRLLRNYALKPFEFFLTNNSTTLSRDLITEVQRLNTHFFKPATTAVVSSVSILLVLVTLIILNPLIALVSGIVFGGGYLIVYGLCRRLIVRLGRQRMIADASKYKVSNEVFSGQREIRLSGTLPNFLKNFDSAVDSSTRASAYTSILGETPKHVLEVIGFGIVTLLFIYFTFIGRSPETYLPELSVYVVAALRLLPQLQLLFRSISQLKASTATVERLYPELRYVAKDPSEAVGRLEFKDTIKSHEIDFCYPNTDQPTLSKISIEITSGSFVGVVGTTGAGKTTLINILLGLLSPSNGQISIDGVPLNESNIAQWRGQIGFVPQDIFLVDDTIAANIAFGHPEDKASFEQIQATAKSAQLHDFIMSLPNQYDTVVGERGVRLSGGQKQRLGIARCLYNKPTVVFFDEATSALDGVTEESVMRAIYELGKDRTLIIIAHRLTTIEKADTILFLGDGTIRAQGTFEGLLESCASFRELAQPGTKQD